MTGEVVFLVTLLAVHLGRVSGVVGVVDVGCVIPTVEFDVGTNGSDLLNTLEV